MKSSKIKSFINNFIKEKNKKPSNRIIFEFLNLWWIHKEFPLHYFTRFLYRKEFTDYKSFIPTKKYFSLIAPNSKIQNDFFVNLLKNKLFFAMICAKGNVATPKMTSYNCNNNFYLDDSKFSLKNNSELLSFFENLFQKLKLNKIIVKNIDAKGGKGIFLIQKKTIKEEIKSIGHLILSGSYIHQECLEQHKLINKIYEHSINTLRFDVCFDANENKHLLGSVMRFGRGGNVIDNRSKGGFFVSVNDVNGSLLEKGYSQMGFGGKEFIKHPDTNFEFSGFKIPYYSEAKQLAMDMSEMIPNKLVGWDIAITPEGPIIIEGNHDTNITMSELAYGGYMKHQVIKELLESV